MIIWIIVLATITTLFGIGYLRGKCDGFIAGLLFLFLMKSDLAAEAMPECGGLLVGVRKMIIFAW